MGLYKDISMTLIKNDTILDDFVEHSIERFHDWVSYINANKLSQYALEDLNRRFNNNIPDEVIQKELKKEREYFYSNILNDIVKYVNYGVTSKYELLGRMNFTLVKIRNTEDTDLEFLFLLMIMFSSIRNEYNLELRKIGYNIIVKYYPNRINKKEILEAAEKKIFTLEDIIEMYE